MRYKQFLTEWKQVGTIYHFTTFDSTIQILKMGYLRNAPMRNYVSFTRNCNMKYGAGTDQVWGSARLVFDGNKLSEKYSIEPFCDVHNEINRRDDECEERILMRPLMAVSKRDRKQPDEIKIKGSLKHVNIFKGATYMGAHGKLVDALEKHKIPYSIVDKFRPYK